MRKSRFTRKRERFRGRLRSKTSRKFKEKVKRIISAQDESKFIDTDISADTVPIAGTSTITTLSIVAEGTNPNQRLGMAIKLTSIEMKYLVQTDGTSQAIDTVARIIIFRAKKNVQGVLPTVAELLISDTVTALRASLGGSDMSDFKVYMDKLFVITKPASIVQEAIKVGKFYKSLGGLKCTFDSVSGDVSATEEGHLYLLRMTNQANTFQPIWSVDIRVRYKEL